MYEINIEFGDVGVHAEPTFPIDDPAIKIIQQP